MGRNCIGNFSLENVGVNIFKRVRPFLVTIEHIICYQNYVPTYM